MQENTSNIFHPFTLVVLLVPDVSLEPLVLLVPDCVCTRAVRITEPVDLPEKQELPQDQDPDDSVESADRQTMSTPGDGMNDTERF